MVNVRNEGIDSRLPASRQGMVVRNRPDALRLSGLRDEALFAAFNHRYIAQIMQRAGKGF